MSMFENENIQTVMQFNEALNAKDVPRMMQCMTQDCIFENTHPPPDGERFVGQDAVRRFWENFFYNNLEIHIEIEEIFGFENRCVMRWAYSWKNRLGETGHVRGIDVYTLINHLISEKLSYVKG